MKYAHKEDSNLNSAEVSEPSRFKMTSTDRNEIQPGCYVKIVSGSFSGFYATVTNKSYGDEWGKIIFKSNMESGPSKMEI